MSAFADDADDFLEFARSTDPDVTGGVVRAAQPLRRLPRSAARRRRGRERRHPAPDRRPGDVGRVRRRTDPFASAVDGLGADRRRSGGAGDRELPTGRSHRSPTRRSTPIRAMRVTLGRGRARRGSRRAGAADRHGPDDARHRARASRPRAARVDPRGLAPRAAAAAAPRVSGAPPHYPRPAGLDELATHGSGLLRSAARARSTCGRGRHRLARGPHVAQSGHPGAVEVARARPRRSASCAMPARTGRPIGTDRLRKRRRRSRSCSTTGRLRVTAGRVVGFERRGDLVDARLRLAGPARWSTVRVGRVVNCTGPDTDLRRVDEPLVQQLLTTGLVTPDPLGLGLRERRATASWSTRRVTAASGSSSSARCARGCCGRTPPFPSCASRLRGWPAHLADLVTR